ncbi:MAG: hypothetical protein KDD47_01540, partial [Acidobacteria bacterium]|nr:hypothetical protein [Acidobacteriota bacterium]
GESAGRAPEPGTWAGACAAAARGPSRWSPETATEGTEIDALRWLNLVASWRAGRGGEARQALEELQGKGYPVVENQLRRLRDLAARGFEQKAWIPALGVAVPRGRRPESWRVSLPEAAPAVVSFELEGWSSVSSAGILRIFERDEPAARLRLEGNRMVVEGARRSSVTLPSAPATLLCEVRISPSGELEVIVGDDRLTNEIHPAAGSAGIGNRELRFGSFGAHRRYRLPPGLVLRNLRVLTGAPGARRSTPDS